MLQDAAGAEPEIELIIRRFGSRLVRCGDDVGAAVRLAVELDTLTLGDVRIITLPETPERLFAVDYRPANSACVVIVPEVSHFMAFLRFTLSGIKQAVLFEQPLLHVKAKVCRLIVIVIIAATVGYLFSWEFIHLAISVEHVK